MDDLLPAASADQSARTSSHRSARSDRIEIVPRCERRRGSLEQKREIVAESLGPGLTPTEVARKYAISSGQLYTWRRELLSAQTAIMLFSTPRLRRHEALASRIVTRMGRDGFRGSGRSLDAGPQGDALGRF